MPFDSEENSARSVFTHLPEKQYTSAIFEVPMAP